MLPKEAINEFKRIYAKNYGVELSDEEATYRANNLVALYNAVYGDKTWRLENDNYNNDLWQKDTTSTK